MTQVSTLMGSGFAPLAAQAVVGGVSNTLTATGSSSLANSYAIQESISIFTTAAGNSGARLPSGANPGNSYWIANYDTNTMLVYPPTSAGKINNGSAGASVSLTTLQKGLFISIDGTNYLGLIA